MHSRTLQMSERAGRMQRLLSAVIHAALFCVASVSAIAVLFIFYFIARDALPFFFTEDASFVSRVKEFFTETEWYPSREPASFGTLSIWIGSGLVTLGAVFVAVPVGVCAAICLSDVLPFTTRQCVKPIIEILAAIPSVAYGFFALVVLAPILQESGGTLLKAGTWLIGGPVAFLAVFVASDMVSAKAGERFRLALRLSSGTLFGVAAAWALWALADHAGTVNISSGTNAFNVSVILGIMALPTVVSVSEDALQAVGRNLREGSYAMGATRAETLVKVVLPAASSGIAAAAILGVMRAIGETMVVWMASGNAAQIPDPWYNYMEPVRTLTATIAGDMGEADHVTGSARFHVLFAMALGLVTVSFVLNMLSEWSIRRAKKKLG